MATQVVAMAHSMTRDPPRLASRSYDLVVVGAGIYGACAAYDAAQRGLRVALIDRGDFGGATSFNSFKIVHGGLRYLQTLDLLRVRESIVERRAMATIAPHLVTVLPCLVPTRPALMRSRAAMSAALCADRIMGYDRNAGVAAGLAIPPGRVVSRSECLRLFPDLRDDAITGAAMWHDYQMPNADRLTLAFVQGSVSCGAEVANHVEVVEPLRQQGRVWGVRARDVLTGQELAIEASVTLNTCGPWAGSMMTGFGLLRRFPLAKALNLVARRPAGSIALGAPTRGGRVLFLAPWRGRLFIGTSQTEQSCPPTDTGVTEAEMAAFLGEINLAFPWLNLKGDEVTLVHRGLVPAVERSGGQVWPLARSEVIDHAASGVEGAVSVVGVKYTTARRVAERAVDVIVRKLRRRTPPCRTATAALPGGRMRDVDETLAAATSTRHAGVSEAIARRLVEAYGTDYSRVLALGAENPQWLEPITTAQPVILAEVVHAIREEMACTLTDAVVRRTGLGAAGHPGVAAAEICANLLARELGWDDARRAAELKTLAAFYSPIGPPV